MSKRNETAAEQVERAGNKQTEQAAENVSYLEIHDLCREYADAFGLMAHLCNKEVDQDLLDKLMGTLYPLSSGNDNVSESSRLIAGYLSKTWEGALDELHADFTATFIGHGSDGHSAAYPYESTYTSAKRLLMQGARTEVLAIYRSQGLDKQDTWRNSEDHISVELEFMQRMFVRAANAFKLGDLEHAEYFLTVLRRFLVTHPLAWVPMMAAEMRSFAKTDFYRGLSFMLVGYLQLAKRMLDEILNIHDEEAIDSEGMFAIDFDASLDTVDDTPAGDDAQDGAEGKE